MSYVPLHHKYRPTQFSKLVGQEAIATTLTNALLSDKIAPAYLFTGPRGTGKTSSARILAKSLNCLNNNKPTPDPCGICSVCQGINKGSILDVIEIDAASNTGVDNIREIIEKSQFAPVQCRYKVYVIDECHMLSTQAFNALLKTLEEPPNQVVFVLATTDPQRVLPTIISRCQRFDFRRINLEAMVSHLSQIAIEERINIHPDGVTLIAQLSQGGLRDAQSLLDQLSLLSGEVTTDRVWDLVGSVGERDLLELFRAIASDNAEGLLDGVRKILDKGREPLTILQNLANFYRDLLIVKTAPTRQDLITCTKETWQALLQEIQNIEIYSILYGQQHLRTAEVQLKNTTQPRLWLELTLLGLLPSAIAKPTIHNITHTTNPTHPTNPTHTNSQNNLTSPTNSTNPTHTNSQNNLTNSTNTTNLTHTNSQNNLTNSTNTTNLTHTNSQNNLTSSKNSTNPDHTNSQNNLTNPTNTSEKFIDNQITQSPPIISTPQQSEYDLNQVWQQVLANIQQIPKRELLRQMCSLIYFDGITASVAIKGAWQKKITEILPVIASGFSNAFQRQIHVNIGDGNSSKIKKSYQALPTTPQASPQTSQPSPSQSSPNNQLTNHQPNNHQPNNHQITNYQEKEFSSPANTQDSVSLEINSNGYRLNNNDGNLSTPPQETVQEIETQQIQTQQIQSQIVQEITKELPAIQQTYQKPFHSQNVNTDEKKFELDEVIQAAKKLAAFFDGQIVGVDDYLDSSNSENALDTLEVLEEVEIDDEDF
jgi:DNA polymerase III subunit gamma/tau